MRRGAMMKVERKLEVQRRLVRDPSSSDCSDCGRMARKGRPASSLGRIYKDVSGNIAPILAVN